MSKYYSYRIICKVSEPEIISSGKRKNKIPLLFLYYLRARCKLSNRLSTIAKSLQFVFRCIESSKTSNVIESTRLLKHFQTHVGSLQPDVSALNEKPFSSIIQILTPLSCMALNHWSAQRMSDTNNPSRGFKHTVITKNLLRSKLESDNPRWCDDLFNSHDAYFFASSASWVSNKPATDALNSTSGEAAHRAGTAISFKPAQIDRNKNQSTSKNSIIHLELRRRF